MSGARLALALIAGLALASAAPDAVAQAVPVEPGIAFKLSSGVPAPWIGKGGSVATPGTLAGKPVTFGFGSVAAPHPIGCDKARYRFAVQPPEGLFQGGLPAPAAEVARQLGLGPQTLTMQVSCSAGVFDFHVVSATRLLFALDNVVWTLDREAGPTVVPPETVVQRVLLDHFTHEMEFTPETAARKRGWFTGGLNAAIARYFAQKFPADEPPPINSDPITNTQDYPTRFEIARARVKDATATVRVLFTAEGMNRPVVFRLRRGDGGAWRVDDLFYERGDTFRKSLAAKP